MAAAAAAEYIEPRPAEAADSRGYGIPAAAKRAGSQSLRLSCPEAAAAAAAAAADDKWLLFSEPGEVIPPPAAVEVTAEWHKLEALKLRPMAAAEETAILEAAEPSFGLRTGLAVTLAPDSLRLAIEP